MNENFEQIYIEQRQVAEGYKSLCDEYKILIKDLNLHILDLVTHIEELHKKEKCCMRCDKLLS